MKNTTRSDQKMGINKLVQEKSVGADAGRWVDVLLRVCGSLWMLLLYFSPVN